MEMIPVVVLVVLGIPIVLAVWLIVRAVQARGRIEELSFRLSELEAEVIRLKQEPAKPSEPAQKPMPAPVAATIKVAEVLPIPPVPKPVAAPKPVVSPQPPPIVAPLPVSAAPTPPRPAAAAPRPTAPAINWEQFMGVKLFAWIGGLALFLGVAFFVKYSFDNNLVPPELRVALGFLAGLGLLVGGVVMSRKNYPALSQTLCATGVVILYAVTFACHSIYKFQFFDVIPTFLLMALITTTAFLLAARLDAMVVAILGMLGGFLTPILLSTGQDNPLGLFGYIAILDAGLIVVALNRRWHFLTALAAAGTVFMQIGWAGKFFETGKYFEGDKILIALAVLLGFNVLYLAAAGWSKIRGLTNKWLSGSTSGLVAVALCLYRLVPDFRAARTTTLVDVRFCLPD